MNKLTFEQANALLEQDIFRAHSTATRTEKISALRDIISRLDIDASGDVTVLYSGMINGDIHSTDVIKYIKSKPNVRVLDNTEAFKFVDFNNRTGLQNKKLNDIAVRRDMVYAPISAPAMTLFSVAVMPILCLAAKARIFSTAAMICAGRTDAAIKQRLLLSRKILKRCCCE